jgi:hypothetical protein
VVTLLEARLQSIHCTHLNLFQDNEICIQSVALSFRVTGSNMQGQALVSKAVAEAQEHLISPDIQQPGYM